MNLLRLFPVILSALLIAAHYLRAGNLPVVAACLIAPALLLVRRPWVPRTLQVGLLLSAGVWVLTAVDVVRVRTALGVPWTTAATILGCVAAWTAASALLFEARQVKARYGRLRRGPR